LLQLADELYAVLNDAVPRLAAFSEAEAQLRPTQGKWSKKEILGHLVDSAANNHQRFVRAQLAPRIELPGYAQEEWVACQAYQARPWEELIKLWEALTRHLAHLVARVPEGSLGAECRIEGSAPVTLEFVMRDYLRHLRHHLLQITG
jgi:hypothetical protein